MKGISFFDKGYIKGTCSGKAGVQKNKGLSCGWSFPVQNIVEYPRDANKYARAFF